MQVPAPGLLSMEKEKFFTNSENYENRELSWLEFNKRVLFEAFDNYNPLFERLKFMSIYFSNLDEFFMVRVGSLGEDAENFPDKVDDKTGWSVKKQIREIYKSVERMGDLLENGYKNIVKELKKFGIDIIDFNNISRSESLISEKYFYEEIFPVLSPQVVDEEQLFPFLKNKEIYIIAILKPLSCASVILHFSGPTVVLLLGAGGGILSCSHLRHCTGV